MTIEIDTSQAPRPNGHYSQAVIHAGVLYTSMQLPLDPASGTLPQGIDAQAVQLFENCNGILVAGGSSFGQVISATIFLTDVGDWETLDRVFAAHLCGRKPARAMVPVSRLHLGALVGMQLAAAVRTR